MPPGRPSLGLSEQRTKFTFVMRTDDEHKEERENGKKLKELQRTGKFQDWIRDVVNMALSDSAHPKSSTLVEATYADPEDSA